MSSVLIAPTLRQLFQHHAAIVKKLKAKQKKYSIRKNLGLLSILPFFMISYPAHIIISCYKLAEPQTRLGIDWGLTSAWMICTFTRHLGTATYTASLTASTLETAGVDSPVIRRAELVIILRFLVATLTCALVWPSYVSYWNSGLSDNFIQVAMSTFIAYCLLTSGVFFSYAYSARWLRSFTVATLLESHKKMNDPRILQVKEVLVRYLNRRVFVESMRALVFLTFGVLPVLYNCHDYLFPLTFLLAPLDGVGAVGFFSRTMLMMINFRLLSPRPVR